MARYYGDFRSTDTSNDPKGQSYRVLVFTQYDGTNPYQYSRIEFLPDEHGLTPAPIVWPKVGTELTMAERPFVATYEGDSENIYKPFRCSTAEVGFMQNDINLDFLNNNGTSTLVVLLKWKNEVSEVGGRMYNRETGETLNKRTVYDTGGDIVLFDGYEPSKYDRFCYNVEWVGFATPETFSMDYDHVRDVFTLNAQDAFCVLQYKKYNWIGDSGDYTVSALDVLLSTLAALGTYRHVYVTKTLRQAGTAESPLASLVLQQKNWYDEDGAATDLRSVLTEILTYLNLTAIPYRDSIVITNANAIADGWDYYDTYSLPNSQCFMNFPSPITADYTQGNETNLSDTLNLGAELYKGGGMSIETGDVYSSVTVECDEYPVPTTLPDISDPDNTSSVGDVAMKDILFYYGGSAKRYHWEHQYFTPATDRIKTFQYEGNSSDSEVETPEYDTTDSNNRPFSVILDDGGCDEGSAASAYSTPYNPTRKIFFHNGAYFNRPAVQPWKPLLYVKSETMMLNDGDHLQIKGDWEFFTIAPYGNHNFDQVPYQYQLDGTIDDYTSYSAINSNMYVEAKVRCGDKWLKNGSLTYGWSSTEQTVKLYFEIVPDAKAFGQTFSFAREYRNFEQIVVKLPVPTGQVVCSPVEIWINQPIGVGAIIARNATLQNLELNILSAEYMRTRGESGKSNTNTEYKSEMVQDAVNEYKGITLKLSSTPEKSARLSQTAFAAASGHIQTPKVYQSATGNLCIPESHITANIVSQYSTPTIGLVFTVGAGSVTPYSRVTWARMQGRTFAVDSLAIDYANDRAETDIREVKTAAQTAETTQSDTTRRFRRNRDFLTDRVTARNTVVLANERIENVTRSISVVNGTARLNTTSDIEGLVTLSPSFGSGDFLVSIPNDIDADAAVTENGELILNFNDIDNQN